MGLCGVGQVQAQGAAPDAGSILQGIERERKPSAPAVTAPALVQPPQPPKSTDEATMLVNRFTVVGNTLLPESELVAVLGQFVNRELTMAQLQLAADAIVQHYLDRGYLVRTLLPRQDVTDGVVRIQVIESSFSGVQIDSTLEGKRITETRLRKTIAAQIQPGDPMSLKKLERGLMLADDTPGINVMGRLVAGTNDLTTGAVLNVTDEPLIYGEAAIDNYGSRSTGPVRLTVNGTLSGALKMGDQFSLFTMKTEGIEFARVGFSLPAGYDGWRVGANASHMQYKVVEEPGLGGKGTSLVLGLDSSYPIFRSRPDNLYYVANLDQKFFKNKSAAGEYQSNYNSVVLSTGFNGSTTDKFLVGGLTSGNLMLYVGKINLVSTPANPAFDQEQLGGDKANAHGFFKKLKYSVTHTQNLLANLIGFAAFTGQWANKNLDSSEKFYLGGPLGVRAYPNNEGGGSEGQLLTLELRQNLPADLVLAAFYDRGRVTVNKIDNFRDVGDTTPNKLTYQGRGLQLTWRGPKLSNIKATWARRNGGNPNPASAGTDQDGTQKLNRYWLSASIPF